MTHLLKRRELLASAFASAAGSSAAPAARLPNIVLIMADDLGYECLGCNGASEYRTPRLDALAAAGLNFTNAHSTPLCTPTRVQLMTGKYNFRNYTEFGSLPPGEQTFAHSLKQAGYRTGIVGKWQLAGAIEGAAYKGTGTLPADAGFDEHCLWQVKALGSRYWDPLIQVNGQMEPVRRGAYGPDLLHEYACGFIERNRAKPFLLYYPMVLTHDPFVPTPRSREFGEEHKNKTDPRWFGDMVAYMDGLTGAIVDKIDALGLTNDTLILFTGDNGTGRGVTTQTRNGPYKGGKGGTTSAGTHVPLLARWTGKSPRGRICEDLIDFTDFFPTFAGLAGREMPSGHPRDGWSFLDQLQGREGIPREWIFCDYNPRWGNNKPSRWVMDRKWKLYGDGRFIDLVKDPQELHPVEDRSAAMNAALSRFEAVLKRMVRG